MKIALKNTKEMHIFLASNPLNRYIKQVKIVDKKHHKDN